MAKKPPLKRLLKINKNGNPHSDCDCWVCRRCGWLNVWAYCDYEELKDKGQENITIASGSAFDNICGNCHTNFVKWGSPILAACYTHRKD